MSNKTEDRIELAQCGFEFYVDKYMELFCEKYDLTVTFLGKKFKVRGIEAKYGQDFIPFDKAKKVEV